MEKEFNGYILTNLMPYREKLKAEKIHRISMIMAFFAILAIGFVFSLYSAIEIKKDYQVSRNKYIEKENEKLDKDIQSIATLKNEIRDTLAKRIVVESLQVNRSDVVHILNILSQELPESTNLKSIKQEGDKLMITGITSSNNKVSSYITNLYQTGFFDTPRLIEIKAVKIASENIKSNNSSKINKNKEDVQTANEFTISVNIKREFIAIDEKALMKEVKNIQNNAKKKKDKKEKK